MPDEFLSWRGVDDPCLRCAGSGIVIYSSGATWRGGMGAASMQRDVCDTCWGTGDRYRTGCDLRRLRDEERKRVAEAALTLIADTCGLTFKTCRAEAHAIAEHLQKLVDKRGTHFQLQAFANALANILRRAIGEVERKLP